MEFDDQLRQYFGTTDLSEVSAASLESATERMAVDLGLEQDGGRRFALWTILYMLGSAPDLEATFKSDNDRNAARDFMDLMDRAGTQDV